MEPNVGSKSVLVRRPRNSGPVLPANGIVPEGYQRCARKKGGAGCKGLYLIEPGRISKACDMCRATSNRNAKSEKGAASRMRSKENGQQAMWNRNQKAKNPERIRVRQNAHGRGLKGKASKKRYKGSEKGKAAQKKYDSSPMGKLGTSLGLMLRGTHWNPVTFARLNVFQSNDDARQHFESTFEPWMNWCNQGAHKTGDGYLTSWQIGHRIPKAWYDHGDEDEIKKAWGRCNLFAQCARENVEANDRNILSESEWIALKPIWPKRCTLMTNDEAWAWARSNQANVERKDTRV